MHASIVKIDRLNCLVVDAAANEQSPVLLFLHGRGEASPWLNELPLVCAHLTPPFQAILGRLQGVTVVAPQAPHKKDEKPEWDWSGHLPALHAFLADQFPGRKILASGFSRGGLGVLKLIQRHPGLVTHWAIVDPQPGEEVLPSQAPDGWLSYGRDPKYPQLREFSERLKQGMKPENVRATELGHGELALATYSGDGLGGQGNIYTFLGLPFE